MCNCRHSKSSAFAVHGISGTVLKNDKAILNLSALNWLVKTFLGFYCTLFPFMRSEVLVAVSTFLWDVTACKLVERYILYALTSQNIAGICRRQFVMTGLGTRL